MDDIEVVHGHCLHGRAIQTLGDRVHFVEACPSCALQLRGEGFTVTGSRAGLTAA